MERKHKGNRVGFIIAVILLIVFSISLVVTFIVFKDKNNKLDKEINDIKEEINSKKEEQEKLLLELEEIDEEIKDFENINQKISELKTTYYNSIKELEDSILNGTSDKKIAYLTFDDGPYYNTYKVLDILDQYNVKATFFTTSINGEMCFDNKNENCYLLYKEYLKRGHTIANHTFSHGISRGLYKSADTFIESVLLQHDQIYEQTGGYIANFIRFPGGSVTAGKLKDSIIEKLRENGYGWVDWSAEDGDGRSLSSREYAWNYFTSTINSPIEVILLHDYNNITTGLLPDIITYLRDNGYILLPLFYESNMINK
jgi:peptidoglycan/xylan/chitin deacetylase (PgdA/CDA1 family)